MRILTVSDKVEPVLYGPYIRERVGKVDLILACGDLPYYYLEYIVSLLDVPLFFVHGNHDRPAPVADETTILQSPSALGWAVNLHERTVHHQGLLLAGLEGSRLYSPGAPYQYTGAQVWWQVFRLSLRLLVNRWRRGRYLDILVTHAPPRGIHDGKDLAHRGFRAYLTLLERCHPLIMVHGHHHVYDLNDPTVTEHGSTWIINTYGYKLLELTPRPKGRGWMLIRADR